MAKHSAHISDSKHLNIEQKITYSALEFITAGRLQKRLTFFIALKWNSFA